MEYKNEGPQINVSGNIGNGNVIATGNIQNSFNQIQAAPVSPEFKELFNQLTEAVSKMSSEMSQEKAKEVLGDLETLTNEINRDKPREPQIRFSLEALEKAAKTMKEIGVPVLELAAKVLPLILALTK